MLIARVSRYLYNNIFDGGIYSTVTFKMLIQFTKVFHQISTSSDGFLKLKLERGLERLGCTPQTR